MEYQRGVRLGALHEILGIAPDARISIKLDSQQTSIWDLQTGIRYEIPVSNPRNYRKVRFEVPQYVTDTISASDDDLKARWLDTSLDGWTPKRAALFSELSFREINILDIERL